MSSIITANPLARFSNLTFENSLLDQLLKMEDNQIPGFRIEGEKLKLTKYTLPSQSQVKEDTNSCWKFLKTVSNSLEELVFDMERTLDSCDPNKVVDSYISALILKGIFIPKAEITRAQKDQLIKKLEQFAAHFQKRSATQRDKDIAAIYNNAISRLKTPDSDSPECLKAP